MQYIPQSEPFVMIDKLISTDETQTTTELNITSDNLFVSNEHFLEPGLIENMAQTAAAGTGYKASLEQKAPTVGFIGQIKNLQVQSLPKVGDKIITTTKNVHQIINAMIVQAEILCEHKMIASAEFKIFLQEN